MKERKYSLDELLSQITDKNRHDEVDFGQSVGKEILQVIEQNKLEQNQGKSTKYVNLDVMMVDLSK